MPKLAVVRIKGGVDLRKEVKDTLKILGLERPNHCRLLDDGPSTLGMLREVKEAVTWGPVDVKTLEMLLRKRGRLTGGKMMTDETIEESTSYEGIGDFAKALVKGDSSIEDIADLKEVFRLNPPRGGFGKTSLSFSQGGAAAERDSKINDLLLQMM